MSQRTVTQSHSDPQSELNAMNEFYKLGDTTFVACAVTRRSTTHWAHMLDATFDTVLVPSDERVNHHVLLMILIYVVSVGLDVGSSLAQDRHPTHAGSSQLHKKSEEEKKEQTILTKCCEGKVRV